MNRRPKGSEQHGDDRSRWLLERVACFLGIRRDKIMGFIMSAISDAETGRHLRTFLDSDQMVCVFQLHHSGESCTAIAHVPDPNTLKRKTVAAIRIKPHENVTFENIRNSIVLLEVTKAVMDFQHLYSNSIYLTLLMNPANQQGWSELVSKEVMDKFHTYLANLYITVGLMRGETLLPMPPREMAAETSGGVSSNPLMVSASSAGKDRVHVLESAVIMWTKQIRHVLKQEPDNVFQDGQNPLPNVELHFWNSRAKNLNTIRNQLQIPDVRKVLKYLETNKSTYITPFSRVQKEVDDASEEANNNVKFLRCLQPHFRTLMSEGTKFTALHETFDGIFHVILLIWKYSRFYTSFSRLSVLIRQVCNAVIAQATHYIPGPTVFEMVTTGEVLECYEMLEKVLCVIDVFKRTYNVYRERADREGNGGWKMRGTVIFLRLDTFRERCTDILDFTRTVLQFNKLDRVDIGGTKGRVLSQYIGRVFEEFGDAVAQFRRTSNDIMDVGQPAFDDDYHSFRSTIKDLDRRLGSILSSAFEDLDTVQGRLKLFDVFEGLLERPIVHAELERKQEVLILQYHEDLKEVRRTFAEVRSRVDACAEDGPIFTNLPPVAGAIFWASSLRSRMQEPMARIIFYNRMLREVPDSFVEVEKLYEAVLQSLDTYEQARYAEWEFQAVDAAKQKLTYKLLRRHDKTGLLKVNFHPELVRLLREVHFFRIFELQIPAAALEMFSRAVTYRSWTSQLHHIVELYNLVLTELLPVEEPLLQDRITKMDTALSAGLNELKWHNEDEIPDFIKHVMAVVSDVSGVVDVMKGNLRKLSGILSSWCKESMLERKRGAKPVSTEEFDLAHKARAGVRLMNMVDGGREIQRYLRDSGESLKISKTQATWKAYVDFVNNIIIEGFVSTIAVSLQYLCEILDPLIIARHEMLPLFDVRIELENDEEITFDPPFEDEENISKMTLRMTIDGWLKDFFAMATVMPRLDTASGDYLNEIKEHFQMQCLLALVSELIDNTELKCKEYRQTFMQYEFLWRESVEEKFETFLREDPSDLVEGFEEEGMGFRAIMDRIQIDIGQPIPSLERFDGQISRFRQMMHDISNLKTPTDIHWLRINALPVRVSLVKFARRWGERYTGFLKKFVEERIASLSRFILKVKVGLSPPSAAESPEDETLLYATMTHIRDVKLAIKAIGKLFQPIREQVQLLKKHQVSVAEERLSELEHAPAQWGEVERAAFNEKEKILPLQSQEMVKIRLKIDNFREDVQAFRHEFLEQCPFGSELAVSGDYDRSYALINEYHERTCEIRALADQYNDLELLFDMSMSDYKPLKDCLDDLALLKNLWDMIVIVREKFSTWYSIPWDKIDTDEMVLTTRDLNSKVKAMPKAIKSWPLFSWVLEEVKNMQTALPLVSALHSETMRDRHWISLRHVTKKQFDKGADFCFRDLLQLELHHFADDVSEIVEQSIKESKIEKKLMGIRQTWSKLTIEFSNTREDCPLLCDLGEVLERLDTDSLEMMSMTSQDRFTDFCRLQVHEWSDKLRRIDSVLHIWRKFQNNWCRLESIFMQSDDIRSQLPDDSKRFEALDTNFKELMIEASQSSLVVEICCAEGREEILQAISDGIESCERSLNDYLEQKKKSFPRFYFVANQTLLDILSCGNQPLKVAEFLGDVFDGIAKLDFQSGSDGFFANGHVAKDGEVVTWYEPVTLEGAVEAYLTTLEAHLRLMMRDLLETARATADNWEVDKVRELWLEDHCAQLSLLASQIQWTDEVSRAFEDLEGGSETAMKDYKKVSDDRIEKLIKRVLEHLNSNLRTKIITIITIDVHSRDVVEGLVTQRITDNTDFKWKQQLRFYWALCPQGADLVTFTPEDQKTCEIRICDWVTIYLYEYVGNIGRLVITPLTDRCYITLTQALNLNLGGAPAGPAGTGKTETTKDLARALGLPIKVFNCSHQMTYQVMAIIFMGLAQVGAWGCFDEFNRIEIEVLSVVSTQYKAILDAIRARVTSFLFMDEDIRLVRTVGAFITMNPGYAGRTELPENLKALFRSVAMIVPDLKFICENMLMSEGFIHARPLAQKFVTLYSLCRELLSKQLHYDWGLRAVKSLLQQAGALKRKEQQQNNSNENMVLCRALRDFNLPKISTLDLPIFHRLIQDLFPGIKPKAFQDLTFEKICRDQVKKRGLQPDPGFIVKIVGLLDILNVRHCCFIIGPAGCGKTEAWRSLLDALRASGQDGMWEQVNPKALTSDELYGTMSKSKEWKDGAIAVIMRKMSKELGGYRPSHLHRWLVLDGDIDATWIESMNTVMDDNRVLTLVSNERIPFTATMRMLLEIQDMKHASPATVSRGGVLYINEVDVGWKPYVESWREQLDPVAQSTFYLLFANCFEANIEQIRKQFALTCPVLDIGFVQSLTCFIDAMLGAKENFEPLKGLAIDEQKLVYEAFFSFSLMWTVGGVVADDKVFNYRKAFNTFMRSTTRSSKLPEPGECFDYRFDVAAREWVHWNRWVTPYNPVAECMFHSIIISTVEIERMKHILDLHVARKKPTLFVGTAGTGKTTTVMDYLTEVTVSNEGGISSSTINLNSYTTSVALQTIMMGYLEKRSGHTYGPPGHKKCIFFIDDLNMPHVDEYDTQSAIMLLTQIISYAQVYDRAHLDEKKDIHDILFTACMNPKAGSFMVNSRLQRHFTVLTMHSPGPPIISDIYAPILGKHLESFGPSIKRLIEPIIVATGEMLTMIHNSPSFLPSASKFHYQFSLKDIANIFQGLLKTNSSMYRDGACKFLRVWLHECHRVFSDRFVQMSHHAELQSMFEKVASKHFVGLVGAIKEELFAQPLVMTSFISEVQCQERHYLLAKDMSSLKKVLEDKMMEYNAEHAAMNLVLFDDAMLHVCRISRITDNPCGHALLIGVGGSGKQSLARLSNFINGLDVLSILVSQQYGMNELKSDFQDFYRKVAVKPAMPHALIMTDGQIVNEQFLVCVNDMLSSGTIPDLFTRDEYDGIFNQIRGAAKYHGYPDDRDSLFHFLVERVQKNLHLILCHSPVGSTFRVRGRKFPALISCMCLDVFHPWPSNALVGVAQRFLVKLRRTGNIADDTLSASVAAHMAEVHMSIRDANWRFLQEERRYNSTTPKSFLELIHFYTDMLTDKQSVVGFDLQRLEKGLEIMQAVQENVASLRTTLQETKANVEEKRAATEELIQQVTAARANADDERLVANGEEEKCAQMAAEAQQFQNEADQELEEAMPAMEAARKAIDCLDKKEIQELKSLQKPPVECIDVCAACGFLLRHEKRKLDWKGCVRMMNNPHQFLEDVKSFDAKRIPDQVLVNTDMLIEKPYFNEAAMKTKSHAAACLANWVVNIVTFHKIWKKVAPLMQKVKGAKEQTEKAERDLGEVRKHIREVEDNCEALDQQLKAAMADKNNVEMQAVLNQKKLTLAERLVNNLADENERWMLSVRENRDLGVKLVGNCLLASAFVGYISPFSARFRQSLWQGTWTKDLIARGIPMTENLDPLTVLATDADIAGWQNEGLPADRVSLENASILTICSRWPLMVDPQQQGMRWLKTRVGEALHIIQLTTLKWLEKVVYCVRNGSELLIEAVGSEIDAVLDPVLSRAIIKRGRQGTVLRLGGDEIEYDEKFQLYLQTKMQNPHYKPELAAQCTIINFIVTPSGLEEQILAMVVNDEKPELERAKEVLVRRQNEYKVALSGLEDDLLSQLSTANPNTVLDNMPLIDGLDTTKATAKDISLQVTSARETEVEINRSRELYRPVAAQGSMLFFLVSGLCVIEHMYRYSLDSFLSFLDKALSKTEKTDDVFERTQRLITMIRITVFRWVNRGLFEDHKLIFRAMLAFRLFQLGQLEETFDANHFEFLLRGPSNPLPSNPLVEWLPNLAWSMVMSLSELQGFEGFAQTMEKEAPNRFKDWFNELAPEDSKLPLHWKGLDTTYFQKLLVIRCLRPDRMAIALTNWIRGALPQSGDYMSCDGSLSLFEVLESSYEDSSNVTPFFFILSPGADPVKEVETLGKKFQNLQANVNWWNVAMGQGQDLVAMQKLDLGHKEGHWVMLQNIHLMPVWCSDLEKRLDTYAAENSHLSFRLFLSADPSMGIPIGILERSIKLTNEPPSGLKENLRRSFALFNKEDFEERDSKIKAILFGLCHFHSLMIERKKFGPLGYNKTYPFSSGDLRDSSLVLYNYLQESTAVKIPWEDLRYIFGEIMYGGHIVDDWDREVCRRYLHYFMQDELLDEKDLVPYAEGKLGWNAPAPGPHEKYVEHIELMPQPESPLYFGMHTNAEIGFRTAQCHRIFETLLMLQPRTSSSGDGAKDSSIMHHGEEMCSEVLDEVRDLNFQTEETSRQLTDDEKGPYQFVLLQECDCMNGLVREMIRGLNELQMGFRGELTMSEHMEHLAEAMQNEALPATWVKLGFPSTRPLRSWLVNLKDRASQLEDWVTDPLSVPKVVDLSKLFSPQGFLTAIKQFCCQEQHKQQQQQQMLELDKLQVVTEVHKREVKQIDSAAREGAFVTGLFLEGARWDINSGVLEDSRPKEMFMRMPVVNCRAGPQLEREPPNVYICPTYCVPTRAGYFVFTAQLRTKQPPAKWVMAGVALILDVGYNL